MVRRLRNNYRFEFLRQSQRSTELHASLDSAVADREVLKSLGNFKQASSECDRGKEANELRRVVGCC